MVFVVYIRNFKWLSKTFCVCKKRNKVVCILLYESLGSRGYSLGNDTGADPGFSFGGGGGAKYYVPARTLRARDRTLFRQGSRARLIRALEALGLF